MKYNIMTTGNLLILILLSYLGETSGAQCKKQATKQGGKLTFAPLNGELEKTTLSTEYDAKGLQPFFNLANSFMNTVQSKKLSEEFKGYDDIDEIFNSENRDKLIKYETPVAVAGGFGVLFLLLMPFVGLCFCCCRCAGKCGGKNYQHHKSADKHSSCLIMTVVLFIVAVMMLCGCMFMFVTNSRTHTTAQNLGSKYVDTVDSVIGVANSTKNSIVAMNNDFTPCLIDSIKNELGSNGITVHFGTPIRDFIKANATTALNTASGMATTVDEVKANLDDIKTKSDALKNDGTSLSNQFTTIKTDLDTAKASCGAGPECDAIDDFKSKVDMEVDFSSLPDVQSSIDQIKEVQDLDISKNVADANKVIEDIPQTVITKTSSSVGDVITVINDLQAEVDKTVNGISSDINKAINENKENFTSYKKYMNKDTEDFKYENYRYYAYIGLSSLVAFMVLLLFGGLILGVCGYSRDAAPSQRSKTATCGGNCLMAAVGFMFIFSMFLMLFCVLWFVVGIHLHFVCRDLKDASVFELIKPLRDLKLENGGSGISIQDTLENCRANKPLYQALGGEKVYNLSATFDLRKMIDIDSMLDKIDFKMDDQTIVSQDLKDALEKLKTSDVGNTDFSTFFNTLDTSITKYNLTELAKNVTTVADQFTTAGKTATANTLRSVATKLKDIDTTTIPSIQFKASALKPEVEKLQTRVLNLKDKATQLLSEVLGAEAFVLHETPGEIIKLVTDFTSLIIDYILQGTNFLIQEATTNLLRCKPVADLYDGLVGTLLCDDIVQNANGFWLALGWCMLFFIPAIIFSVRLAKYYRKMEYDSGMDQNFENPPYNDKIPLQTYGTVERRDDYGTATENSAATGHDMLIADDLEYDHHAPPPYQNQGYANQ